MLAVGSTAPGFSLEASGGNQLGLNDLAGGYAVIVFYPKNNTPG